jgi:sensor c-di-GMP phosphodiesterase-like protein
MMRVFADLAADVIERNLEKDKQRDEKAKRIQSVISGDGLSIVYQPIINVAQDKVGGFESLTRLSATPLRGPDVLVQ